MDEILKTISSPVFLVGTLFCGLLLNIVSNYVQRHLDKASARFTAWRGAKSAAKQAVFDADLRELVENPSLVELYIARESRIWSAALLILMFALMLGGIYGLATSFSSAVSIRLTVLGVALVCLVTGMALMDSAMRAGDVLRALYKERRGER